MKKDLIKAFSPLIVFILVISCLTFIACDDYEIKNCPPEGYDIIFNGDQYAWRIIEAHYIHPVFFDTENEALNSCFDFAEGSELHRDRYRDVIWVTLGYDCFLNIPANL